MTVSVLTLHRRPGGDPADVRVVADGFRPSVFLLAPAALLARRLWVAFAVWLVVVAAAFGATAAGWLSGWAACLAVLVLHAMLAIDAPNLERRRLEKQGWQIVALGGPEGLVSTDDMEHSVAARAAAPATSADVIGLFPGALR